MKLIIIFGIATLIFCLTMYLWVRYEERKNGND